MTPVLVHSFSDKGTSLIFSLTSLPDGPKHITEHAMHYFGLVRVSSLLWCTKVLLWELACRLPLFRLARCPLPQQIIRSSQQPARMRHGFDQVIC